MARFSRHARALVVRRSTAPRSAVVCQLYYYPFAGAGTVGVVAEKLGREFIGIELNPAYVAMADKRIRNVAPLFAEGA